MIFSPLQRLAAVVVILIAAGCSEPHRYTAGGPRIYTPERPTVNLPLALRQENWTSNDGWGSCVYATMVSAFRWQGRPDLAMRMKRYAGGSWPERLDSEFAGERIRWAATTEGDVAFLEWACQTRRGAGIVWGYKEPGGHMLLLVHLDDKWAAVIDNNDPSQVQWFHRDDLIDWWQRGGGWAVTPVYSPVPPPPYRSRAWRQQV